MDLATLFVRFRADTSDVDKSVRQMEASTTKAGSNIASTLAKAFSAAAVIAGIKKSVDAASDLNETVSKTEVIFGNASAAVEKAGDSAAKSMGLSKRAYLDAASSLKGLLDNMGLAQAESTQWSQKLVSLGSDLGSFFNKDPEEAIQAIGAAIRGETEPIRAFNVQISQAAVVQKALELGLISSAGEMENNAKAQATLALITEQTTTAQGDFARTSDGAANSQRIAKAEAENTAASFGQVLLPIYTRVVQVVGEIAAVFGSLPAPVQTALVALVGFVALSGPISKMVEVAGGIQKALVGLGASAGPIGLAIAAVGYLAAAMSLTDDTQKQVAARAKEVAANLDEETDSIIQQRIATGQGTTATQAYADAQAALSAALTGSDDKGQKLVKSLGALGFQAGDAAKVLGLLKTSSEAAADTGETLAAATARGADAAYLATLRNRDLAIELLTQKGIGRDVAAALVQAGQGASYMGSQSNAASAQTKNWTTEQKALLAAILEVGAQAGGTDVAQIATDYLNAEVATSKFRAGLVAQAEAQTGASRSGAEASSVYAAYVQILENLNPEQAKQLELTDQQSQANQQVASSFTDASRAAAEYEVRQAQLKARQEANADATDKLNAALDETGDTMYGAEQAANDLDNALRQLLGIGMDVEEANRALEEGIDKVTSSVKENGNTLDIQTEKGRANRAAIQDQVEAIENKIKADVASGVAVTDATNAGLLYRQQLIDTAVQTGLSREAAEDYVNQLGLTPENVTTAVELQHDEEVKARLGDLLIQLGDIDAGAAAEIQALIDQGAYDEAERRLNEIARNRAVLFVPSATNPNGRSGGTGIVKSAYGRVVRGGSNLVSSLGERPGRSGDEVVLPLGDPARMRQLTDGDIGSRIMDAIGPAGGAPTPTAAPAAISPAARLASSVTGVHVERLEIRNDTGRQALAQIAALIIAGIG